ncbi:MAG: YdeI/OmpD-associated family protein [Candidatus Pedobacter colombiensis]|uniref:YdeI/OmpD-associated family protein n=1 Tax=Candidatus Pedobacter colombiensis TaxID=3121371 RepID=A0AAJ5WCM5_9SPHI|nr:YdeI/OmpD-associated family protein [Pedobacter sp.]WEK21115.1 MAG: YdeI/OmpD-associated family protein [Pedobacter sp.]
MEKYDPRVDAYIAKSADFAQPILKHLRMLVHQASHEITETIKWGFPVFDYKGIVCNMAAFKAHCAFGFWKGALLPDPDHILGKEREQAMGQLGKITCLADIPQDHILISYIQNAVLLNKEGKKVPKKTTAIKTEIQIPDYFKDCLSASPLAQQHFEKFSYSQKKEYLEWITEAKTEQTREKRLTTAIEWISEGKYRNWKYMR